MALKPLSLNGLAITGLIETIDDELGKIGTDVVDRPMLKEPRKVTVEIILTPCIVGQGTASGGQNMPDVDWKVGSKIPGHSGMTTRAYVDKKLGVMVNDTDPLAPDPRQGNILDYEKEDK